MCPDEGCLQSTHPQLHLGSCVRTFLDTKPLLAPCRDGGQSLMGWQHFQLLFIWSNLSCTVFSVGRAEYWCRISNTCWAKNKSISIHWWIKICCSFYLLSRVYIKRGMWGNVHNLSHALDKSLPCVNIQYLEVFCALASLFRGENVVGATDPLPHLHPPAPHLLHHQHHPLPCCHRTKPWRQEALHWLPIESIWGGICVFVFAKKYMLQYSHNSKEKKDYEGAKSGGFFVGKEIPDSDSSEEGEYCILCNWLRLLWRRYHWLMNDVQTLISHCQNLNQSWSRNNVSSLSSSLANSTNTTISIILFLETSKSG